MIWCFASFDDCFVSVRSRVKRNLIFMSNAMISTPVQGFKSTQMFILGYGGSGGVDYCKPFWNWVSMEDISWIQVIKPLKTTSQKIFERHHHLLYTENWKTVYTLIGPIFKINADKFSAIANIKAVIATTNVPTLSFYKTFRTRVWNVQVLRGWSVFLDLDLSAGLRVTISVFQTFGCSY